MKKHLPNPIAIGFFLILFLYNGEQKVYGQPGSKIALLAKLSHLALIDPNTPVVQPGIEIRYATKLSLQVEIGISIKALTEEITPHKINNQFSKWRSELKYFADNRGADANKGASYFALEVFAGKELYQKARGLYTDDETDIVYAFDTASIRRRTMGACIKFGYVLPLTKNKRLTMELAGGLGVRSVNIQLDRFVNERVYDPGLFVAILNSFRINRNDELEGTTRKPHLAASWKFGYRLF